MPQMAPLWWETLFLSFIIMMMIVMIMLYHDVYANIYSSGMKMISEKNINWKW
nr:ATP synthase F0 subunit 8 [Microdeuterus sp. HEM078]